MFTHSDVPKCPNPSKNGGCGCPTSERRCRSSVKFVQRLFNENWSRGGIIAAINETLASIPVSWGWDESELLSRFTTITKESNR